MWIRRQLSRVSYIYRCTCRRRCARKQEKEKIEEDLDIEAPQAEGIELGAKAFASPAAAAESIGANRQDADERLAEALGAAEVPSWQMPKLVIECSQRPGARIHRGTSVILPDAGGDLIAGIVSNLPTLLKIKPCWQLGYSMAVDGVSLKTLYRQVGGSGPCILVVEDSSNCIFGAFLSDGLRPGARCYGSHECFLFRYPRAGGAWRTQVYGVVQTFADPSRSGQATSLREEEPKGEHWANYFDALQRCQAWSTSAPNAGVFCDHSGIVIGIDGPGLFIDQNLLRGVSWPSAAFGSPCLAAAGSGPDFVVRNLEVWHWA